MVRWLDRQLSKRALARMNLPREWLEKGPDGFRAEDGSILSSALRIEPESDRVLLWSSGRVGAPSAAHGRPRIHACRAVLALLPKAARTSGVKIR